MILKNKKGIERTLKLLLEFDKNNNKYLVYKDINTLNIYSGRLEDKYLKPLSDEEYQIISNLLEKISG